ncbi:MAG: hypothetical protein GWN61_07945, partial [candidate division Zixibacteria bacterium]|nr:hypothetical protein [candidate division Zixibacteria bacterium]NIS45943.1 hypothetical protein [candidate division Zixibacteria bacterium]NIU14075.1 hypothetical protein [candidate division Zixibacteria bacterium]NIV06108.1 hypothetical protein [candidate division Zixibacteria bacterium]NIW44892.1 hypothetical protein [Gammaproteobacteria bacterium]
LQQLTLRDSQQLISEILQKVQDLPLQIADLIVSRAQGNPFYIEELIKHLIETGAIIKSDPDWKIDPSQ